MVEAEMAIVHTLTAMEAIRKETTDPKAPVLLLLKQACI